MIQENCNERRGTNSSHGCMNDWQFYNQTHEKAIHKPLSRLLNSLFCLSSSSKLFSCLGYMILGQKGRSFLILPIGMLNYGKPYLVHSFCTLKLDRNSERVDEWLQLAAACEKKWSSQHKNCPTHQQSSLRVISGKRWWA